MCTTSGWNMVPVEAPVVVGDDREGRAPSLTATTSKPGGFSMTLSPWLIQACSVWPGCHSPSNSRQSPVISRAALAEFAMVG